MFIDRLLLFGLPRLDTDGVGGHLSRILELSELYQGESLLKTRLKSLYIVRKHADLRGYTGFSGEHCEPSRK